MLQPFCWLDHILLCTVVVSIYNKNTQFGWKLETIVLIPVVMSWGVWLLVSPRLRNDLSNSSERLRDLWHELFDLEICLRASSAQFPQLRPGSVLLTHWFEDDGWSLFDFIYKDSNNNLVLQHHDILHWFNLFNKSYVHAYCSHGNEK